MLTRSYVAIQLEDLRLERIEERERWWELFDMTRRTHESDDEGAENKKETPDEPAKKRRSAWPWVYTYASSQGRALTHWLRLHPPCRSRPPGLLILGQVGAESR